MSTWNYPILQSWFILYQYFFTLLIISCQFSVFFANRLQVFRCFSSWCANATIVLFFSKDIVGQLFISLTWQGISCTWFFGSLCIWKPTECLVPTSHQPRRRPVSRVTSLIGLMCSGAFENKVGISFDHSVLKHLALFNQFCSIRKVGRVTCEGCIFF